MACFFRHSPTHRWSRRSRRKCNPPTIRFSWCLVELELKYTSKSPRHRRLYQKDEINRFLRIAGSKKRLILCGGPHQKRKEKKPILHITVDDLKWNTNIVALGIWIRFFQNLPKVLLWERAYNCRSLSYGDPLITHHLLRQIGLYTWA